MNIHLKSPLFLTPNASAPATDAHHPQQATAHDRLFIVADGRGESTSGAAPSQIAIDAIVQSLSPIDLATQVLRDEDVLRAFAQGVQALDKQRLGQLRASVALMAVHKGGVTVAFVGNCRAYQVRSAVHEVLFQSRDHSEAYADLEAGKIAPAEVHTHDGRAQLTHSLDPRHPSRNTPEIVHLTDLRPGDCLLLCTDGFTAGLAPSQVAGLLDARHSAEKQAQLLAATAIDSQDAATAILVALDSVTLEACDLDAPTPLQLLPANAMRLHPLAGEAPTLVMATAPLRQPSAWSRMWQNWGDFWVRYRKNAFWALAVAFGLLAVFALLDNLDKFQCSSDKTEEVTTTPDPAAPVVEAPVEEPSLLGGDTTAEEKPIEVPKPKAPVIKTEELPEPVELETMPRNEHEPAPAVPATPSEPKPAETPKPAAPAAPKPTEQAKPKPTETPKPAQPKPAEPAGPLKES